MMRYLRVGAAMGAAGLALLSLACHASTAPDGVIRADGTMQGGRMPSHRDDGPYLPALERAHRISG